MRWNQHRTFVAEQVRHLPELGNGVEGYSILRNGKRGGMAAHLLDYSLSGEEAIRFFVRAETKGEISLECFGAVVNWLDGKEKKLHETICIGTGTGISYGFFRFSPVRLLFRWNFSAAGLRRMFISPSRCWNPRNGNGVRCGW